MIDQLIDKFKDPWIIIGFAGQGLFFSRFIVQWLASEKAGKSVVPTIFWYLSISGSALLLVYSYHIQDPIFLLASFLNIFIYLRNIYLIKNPKTT